MFDREAFIVNLVGIEASYLLDPTVSKEEVRNIVQTIKEKMHLDFWELHHALGTMIKRQQQVGLN